MKTRLFHYEILLFQGTKSIHVLTARDLVLSLQNCTWSYINSLAMQVEFSIWCNSFAGFNCVTSCGGLVKMYTVHVS